MAGVADRLGHRVDRRVGEGARVELGRPDVLGVEEAPGLVDEAESRSLSPDRIYRFVFAPGFSTASTR